MKNQPILFIMVTLLMLITSGCTENRAEYIVNDSVYQLNSNNDVVICTCDITHDGVIDTIEVDCSDICMDTQAVVSVTVFSGEDNRVINVMNLALPHMGWNMCYLNIIDNKCYFVEYNPSHSQGLIHDYIKVFYVDNNGREIVYDRVEYNKEIDSSENEEWGQDEEADKKIYDEKKEYYLSNAVCLVSTHGGVLEYYGM